MSFSTRYLLQAVFIPWLFALAVTVALASQVLRLDRQHWIRFAAIALATSTASAVGLSSRLAPFTRRVEIATDSETLSATLSQRYA